MSDSGCSVDTASPTADVPRNGQDVTDYMLCVSPTKGPVSLTGNHLVRVLSSANASKGLVRVATPTEEVMPASAILHHQYQLSHLPNCQQHPHQYYQLQQSYPPHFHTHQQYPSATSHDNSRVRRPTSVSPVNQLPLPPPSARSLIHCHTSLRAPVFHSLWRRYHGSSPFCRHPYGNIHPSPSSTPRPASSLTCTNIIITSSHVYILIL
jgi:hypothetical protein